MGSGLDVVGTAVIHQNLLLFQGLGICYLIRGSKDMKTAGSASIFMVLAMVTGSVLLFALETLRSSAFALDMPLVLLLGIASALLWRKLLGGSGFFADQAGILDTALIGSMLLLSRGEPTGSLMISLMVWYALGFSLAVFVLAGIRERLEQAPIPKYLRGVPILLITVGIFGVILMGFRF